MVDWPIDQETGEVFDLDWLDASTRKPVAPAEQLLIDRAAASSDPGSILYAEGVPSHVRTEYHRQKLIVEFGCRFLHQPAAVLRTGDVRGVFYLEWDAHIDQLKRAGHLEEALALTYECIDAAERLHGGDAAGWYERATVILRQMKDYDAEIRLIEDVTARWPKYTRLRERLPRARALALRSQA